MPKIALLIFISFLLIVNIAAQDAAIDDAASIVIPGIARFPYTKAPAPEKDPVIPDSDAANLIGAATYAFSAQSGIALEDMSNSTQLIGPGSDNDNSAVADIGFLYRYDGGFFTNFGVNTNGLLRLGGATSTNLSLNALNSVSNSPKIAPYWDDLCTGNAGKVHYKLIPGPVGTQKLVIEWRNVKIPRNNSCDGSGAATFQLWLYDRTGVIRFVYGNGITGASVVNGGYSVGIQSGAATNFASVATTTNSVSYTTAENTQVGAIPFGTSYLFSPNIPDPASGLNASPVGQGSATINWTDNAIDETGYLVRRTTDMVNFYFVSGTLPPNSTTFTDTGLTPGTQYFYFVNAMTEGAFSADASLMVTTNPPRNISSTPAGGPWSSPSTWAGGIVPDSFDNVTIAGGATVTIDTAGALAGNVTVSPSAFLKFGENGAFKLTVSNNVVVDAGGMFTTGGGNANQHILSLGGNLTNNGTLDFSTNNNQAAAGIVFTGATSNTFGGSGSVTDIFTLTVDKGSSANILDLAPANFTVQGSATDGPGSGFLYLNAGTFKISGTFSGNHRTFASPNYQVIAAAGLWLNNPNYTIAAQNGSAGILGLLRISAGNYNVGTTTGDALNLIHLSTVLIEGGSVTVSGSMGIGQISTSTARLTYTQTGGTVSTCTIGRFDNYICFDMGELTESSVTLAGGDIVIQNSQDETLFKLDYRNITGTGMTTTTNTTVHFGNALTTGSGLFAAGGRLPNVVLSANHSLKYPTFDNGQKSVRNFTIEPGAVLHGGVKMFGTQFINNGLINSTTFTSFGIEAPGQDVVYSGVGTVSGVFATFSLNARSLTISPQSGNIRVWVLTITSAVITNAERFIIGNGNNDNIQSRIEFKDNVGSMDMNPNFDIGTGGLKISYEGGPRTTGPEIPSNRIIPGELLFIGPGPYVISGGDLTVNSLNMFNGIVTTNGSTITALVGVSGGGGGPSYLDGTLRRRINNISPNIFFPLRSLVTLDVRARVVPSYITVSTVDQPLPGLLPSTAVQNYWKIVEEGDVTAYIQFQYPATGNFTTYRIWRSTGGTPQEVPFGPRDAASIGTDQVVTQFTGDWGVGAQLDPGPVSISGKVTSSGGLPIRNATVTISGGNLPSPVTVLTGSFGTYIFSGLQAGLSYHITASAKRYRFPPGGQNINPSGNVENVDFVANPQEE
jgi:hypothetical protein